MTLRCELPKLGNKTQTPPSTCAYQLSISLVYFYAGLDFISSYKKICSTSVSCQCFYSSHLHYSFDIKFFFSVIMAPFGLLSYGQNVIDEIYTQILVEEYIAKNGLPPNSAVSTASPSVVIADDTDLSQHAECARSDHH